jgi:hypothetical protein
MTAPFDEDVDVPLRLEPVVAGQGWRGRTAGIVAVALVGFVAIGIVLGTASDRGPAGSAAVAGNSPVPAPTRSPAPSPRATPTRVPLATPLPTTAILGGHIPTERRLVYASGVQMLDLATGTLISPARPYSDVMLPLSDDQFVCACLVRGVPGADGTVADPGLRFGRYDLAGEPIVERDLVTFTDSEPVDQMTEGANVVVALDAARQHLLVLVAVRRPPVWTVELLVVDATSGEMIGRTALDSLPVDFEEPGPSASSLPGGGLPEGVYVWPIALATSPDDGVAYASISRTGFRGETWTNDNHEWMIPLRAGAPGTARRLLPAAGLRPSSWCLGRPTFLDAELMTQVCTPAGGDELGSSYYVRRLTAAGESLGDLAIPSQPLRDSFQATALVDPADRAVLLWEPGAHVLTRIAIDDGDVEIGTVPPSLLPAGSPGRGSYIGASPGLVVSTDGRRLYAIGLWSGPGPDGTTTGVWVFDGGTLELVDHWAARAFLTSLAVSADGQFVYAAAAPGYDGEGRVNPWPASVTVYDASTGEIQVVYGAVSSDAWIAFPTDP